MQITDEMMRDVTEKFWKLNWKPDDDWWCSTETGAVYLVPEPEDIEIGTIEELSEMDEHEFALHVAIRNVTRAELVGQVARLKAELAEYHERYSPSL